MDEKLEPDSARYTLSAAPGLEVSRFALGLLGLIALHEARMGARLTNVGLAELTGLTVETIRKVIWEGGTFEVDTLRKISEPFGAERWEDLVVRGMEFQKMGLENG